MTIVRVALDIPLPRLFDYLAEDVDGASVGRLARVPFGRGDKLGLIVQVQEDSQQPRDKLKPIHGLVADLPPLPADWIALCEFCARYYQHPLGEVTSFALPPLLRRGKLPRRRKPASQGPAIPVAALPTLNDEQANALAVIGQEAGFETFLLHGVTGSGKTEVYLQAIARTLAQGRQALMLVPEIAHTPQLEGRVATRFPGTHIVSADRKSVV
jgi:primosomal protein N' (replication factor Y)